MISTAHQQMMKLTPATDTNEQMTTSLSHSLRNKSYPQNDSMDTHNSYDELSEFTDDESSADTVKLRSRTVRRNKKKNTIIQ